jgi:phenylpropionate dioxygenase-like ring-hydroxylating dioxygenase large terminal subunit
VNVTAICLGLILFCPSRVTGDAVPQFEPYGTENLVRVRTKVYGGIKANWKLLMENFMEYYHLEPVHPQLCAVSGVDEHVRMQVLYDVTMHGNAVHQHSHFLWLPDRGRVCTLALLPSR